MPAHPTEPIRGVAGIWFAAVKDAVPKAAVDGGKILCDFVRLVEAVMIEPQTAHRALGRSGGAEQIGRSMFRDLGGGPRSQQRGDDRTVVARVERHAFFIMPSEGPQSCRSAR